MDHLLQGLVKPSNKQAARTPKFYSSRHLLPSVPLSKGLTESFREDRKQDKGPTEMVRRVHAQCVIPFSKWFTRGQMPAKSVREPSTGSEG